MPTNTAKKLDQEIPFATYGPDQVPIKESDISFVASIIGYAKKHVGLSEAEAFHYAMSTFVLLQTGSGADREIAEITVQNVFSWESENRGGLDKLMDHQLECRLIFQRYFWLQ